MVKMFEIFLKLSLTTENDCVLMIFLLCEQISHNIIKSILLILSMFLFDGVQRTNFDETLIRNFPLLKSSEEGWKLHQDTKNVIFR